MILMADELGPSHTLKAYGVKLLWMFAGVSNLIPGMDYRLSALVVYSLYCPVLRALAAVETAHGTALANLVSWRWQYRASSSSLSPINFSSIGR